VEYISYRSSAIARSCWKKYFFDSVEHLVPRKHSTSLITGRILHGAMEQHYLGVSHDDCLDYIRKSFAEEISKAELIDQEELVVARYQTLGMFGNFPFAEYDAEITEVIPEMEFEVPLPSSRGIRFIGRLDGLVLSNGNWWVREFKTTGLSMRQFEGRASKSAQGTGYVYGANKKTELPIAGIMFDIIKRPMLRKRLTENMDQFGLRIMKDYHDRPEFYYRRYYTYRTETDINLWQQDMTTLIQDIRMRKKTGRYYRNPEACWQFNQECPYSKICWDEKPDELTVQLCFEKGESYAERKKREATVNHTEETLAGQDGQACDTE